MAKPIPKASRRRPAETPRPNEEPAAKKESATGRQGVLQRLQKRPATAISVFLFALVIWGFLPALLNGFVNFDDNLYVYENLHVRRGLDWPGIRWAFANLDAAFWHPLTWLSLMVDCQLYGLRAWGFHLTSLLLHAANTVLLFLALQRMTGAAWRSALVAALFGLHPLHVESVAWVAERKDVLSTFFWMLTLLMYARYVEQLSVQGLKPEVQAGGSMDRIVFPESSVGKSASLDATARVTCHASLYYGLALAFFICGLMSKTMVVTLPLILLLLDGWPLARFKLKTRDSRLKTLLPLVREKLPFLMAAIVFGILTLYAQGKQGTLPTAAQLPTLSRVQSAVSAYWGYPGQMLWPMDLAVYYPYQAALSVWLSMGAAAGLIVLSGLILWAARHRPYLGMGWMWYLLTLLPVAGLIQVSGYAHADRFTYVPLIGIFVAGVWWAEDAVRGWRWGTVWLWAAGMLLTALCLAGTRRQLGYWKDSEALFRHALAVTADNSLARNNLGDALLTKGQADLAIEQFKAALQMEPSYAEALNNLGLALLHEGKLNESIERFRNAVQLAPGRAVARINLGIALGKAGRLDEAVVELEAAIARAPDSPNAHCTLGDALAAKGRLDEAAAEYRQAAELAPDDAIACHNLGIVLGMQNRPDKAVAQFAAAIRLNPRYTEAHGNLGITLLRQGRLEEAVRALREAVRLEPKLAVARHNLAVALATLGQLEEALGQFAEVLKLEADSAEVHCDYGVALGKAGRWVEAVRQFQEALKLRPDYPEARSNLQVAQEKLNAGPAAMPH